MIRLSCGAGETEDAAVYAAVGRLSVNSSAVQELAAER